MTNIDQTLKTVEKKLDLLIEGQQTLLKTLPHKSRVERLEEDISLLKVAVKLLAEKVDSLSA